MDLIRGRVTERRGRNDRPKVAKIRPNTRTKETETKMKRYTPNCNLKIDLMRGREKQLPSTTGIAYRGGATGARREGGRNADGGKGGLRWRGRTDEK